MSKPKPVMRKLPIRLTADEEMQKAHDLARAVSEQASQKERKKAAASVFATRIKELAVQIQTLSTEIATHTTERAVACYARADWGQKTVDLIRSDTGEIVETRTMTSDELQLEMDGASQEGEEVLNRIFDAAALGPDVRRRAAHDKDDPDEEKEGADARG